MKLKLLPILFFILFSCTPATKKNEPNEIEIIPSVTTFKNVEIEQIMVKQLNGYLTAFTQGDSDIAISYIYPGMFDLMKKEFPDEYSPEIMKEILSKPIEDLKKMQKEKNVKFVYEIGEITRRVNYGNDMLLTIVVRVKMKNGLDDISTGDEIIAISLDKGQTWKFLQLDKEISPKVLRLKYPESIVNKVIN
ncbi:MAG: hypothetical protein HQ521_04475 [Bacteroidetes bacterium]|nr:hypothetical protein [Bacteroidota bacterium]